MFSGFPYGGAANTPAAEPEEEEKAKPKAARKARKSK